MQNQTVYLLYEQSGEYSDYGMGILGIFSSVDAAKAWLEKDCNKKYKDIQDHPEQYVGYSKDYGNYTHRTSWEPYEAGYIEWHCSLIQTDPNYFHRKDWTIAPYVIDAPE